ncbi:DUF4160 domain-containing protein [Parabacteroides sp.]
MSPKFLCEDGYIFKIYSNEEERVHIHVVKAEREVKFWLEPVIELAENFGFNSKEIKVITKMIDKYGDEFRQQYKQYIGKRVDD